MQIHLKLMGMLKEKTPDGGTVEVADNAAIGDVLAALDIPADSVHVFMVNGNLERNKSHRLTAGDELSIVPPVGGG